MSSALKYLPLVHHDDLIAVANGRQTVSHDDLCGSHHTDGGHHLVLCLGVEGTRGLVHNQDRRLTRQRCGDLHPLPLSTAEVLAALDQLRGETFRTTDDVVADLCITAGHHHRKLLDGFIPHADILCHRIIKQHDVLVDDGHGVRELLVGDALDGTTVKQDLAAPGLIESADEFRQRRLAATARAHESYGLSRFYAQVEVLNKRGLQTRVAKGDILHLQQAVELAFGNVACAVAMVLRIFHDVLHTLHLTAHLDNGLRGVHNLVDRREER